MADLMMVACAAVGVPNVVGGCAAVGFASFGQAKVIAGTMWMLTVTSLACGPKAKGCSVIWGRAP